MSVQVQLRRDTYANVAANFGAPGELFIDTTNQRVVVQDGATPGGFPAPVTLSVQSGGSTNNSSSGSGAFVNHTPTFTLPANFMIAARAFRVSAHFQLTTGSAEPTLTFQLALGATAIWQAGGIIPIGNNLTNVQIAFDWLFQATAAPSGASNVQCCGDGVDVAYSTIGMPVAVATNAAQAITVATKWATAGTGTNTITLNQLVVEALN
jgi:hypothetical protein